MSKCDNAGCENHAVKPSSTAFERLQVPNVFAYFPDLGKQRHVHTRHTAKYFCDPKCLYLYLRDNGIIKSQSNA